MGRSGAGVLSTRRRVMRAGWCPRTPAPEPLLSMCVFFSQESLWTTHLVAFVKIDLLELGYKKEIATICINSLQTMGDKSSWDTFRKWHSHDIQSTNVEFIQSNSIFFIFFETVFKLTAINARHCQNTAFCSNNLNALHAKVSCFLNISTI